MRTFMLWLLVFACVVHVIFCYKWSVKSSWKWNENKFLKYFFCDTFLKYFFCDTLAWCAWKSSTCDFWSGHVICLCVLTKSIFYLFIYFLNQFLVIHFYFPKTPTAINPNLPYCVKFVIRHRFSAGDNDDWG